MWGGGILLGILGGGVPPSCLIPDNISEQKCHFPDPFSDQTAKIHTRFSLEEYFCKLQSLIQK